MKKLMKWLIALFLIALLIGGIFAIKTPGGLTLWQEMQNHLP